MDMSIYTYSTKQAFYPDNRYCFYRTDYGSISMRHNVVKSVERKHLDLYGSCFQKGFAPQNRD